ncbi:MAG: putative carboxymuconolactone decarboxylase [Acidimicrobiales bacterium]|nr:putative carboxymuconolactone decarboxylase [Acidimicrobiales bacterium]
MSDGEERRQRGLAWMRTVYGWDVPTVEGDFVELTVDHLFGEVWAREGLSLRDRRLLLLGLLVGSGGLDDVIGLQLDSALAQGDLSDDDLREIVVFLTHYAGWPKGAKLNSAVEDRLARRERG